MKNAFKEITSSGRLFVKMGRYVSFVAPVMVVITTLLIGMTASQVSSLIAVGAESAAAAINKRNPPQMRMNKLDAAGYSEMMRLISLNNPAVKVDLTDDKQSLRISIADPAALTEWVYALSTLQSYRPGLIWSANTLCLQKCQDGKSAVAEVYGYTQEISLSM